MQTAALRFRGIVESLSSVMNLSGLENIAQRMGFPYASYHVTPELSQGWRVSMSPRTEAFQNAETARRAR